MILHLYKVLFSYLIFYILIIGRFSCFVDSTTMYNITVEAQLSICVSLFFDNSIELMIFNYILCLLRLLTNHQCYRLIHSWRMLIQLDVECPSMLVLDLKRKLLYISLNHIGEFVTKCKENR